MMADENPMRVLAIMLDQCEPEDDEPVTWGSLRRQVVNAADALDGLIRPATDCRCLWHAPSNGTSWFREEAHPECPVHAPMGTPYPSG